VYQQDCYEIFDKFFLHNNAFHKVCDATGEKLSGSMFGSAYGGSHAPAPQASKDVEVDLACTIMEFYHGSVKYVTYKRQTVALDGHTVREDSDSGFETVVVKPGMQVGTKLRFKGKGNEQYKKPATDLIVTLVEDKVTEQSEIAKNTKRRGAFDLIYNCKVSLQQSLKAEPVTIETLDGRLLKVPIDQVITPKTVIRLEGEGLVQHGVSGRDPLDPPVRGDLYVKFEIRFPSKLSESHR